MNDKSLINRLARIQGQIEALKKSLNSPSKDCHKDLLVLKAAINGLKKFGAAYMIHNIEKCLKENKNQEQIIKTAIETGFDI